MKTLQHALESLLDSDFDITTDDIKPLEDWVRKNKGKRFRLRANAPVEEMTSIITACNYGEKVGRPTDIDWDIFLADLIKSGDSFLVSDRYINGCEIWQGKKSRTKHKQVWLLHTQNPNRYGCSWFGSAGLTPDDIKTETWNTHRTERGRRTIIYRLYGHKAIDEIRAAIGY